MHGDGWLLIGAQITDNSAVGTRRESCQEVENSGSSSEASVFSGKWEARASAGSEGGRSWRLEEGEDVENSHREWERERT